MTSVPGTESLLPRPSNKFAKGFEVLEVWTVVLDVVVVATVVLVVANAELVVVVVSTTV